MFVDNLVNCFQIYDQKENTMTLALRITNLQPEDYGTYECHSQNMLGQDSEYMVLYGMWNWYYTFCSSYHNIETTAIQIIYFALDIAYTFDTFFSSEKKYVTYIVMHASYSSV